MFTKTVLDNGIRILSEQRPEMRSVSLGIWVENGSRHESRPQNGISHFIEHLLFKGTNRRSAARIAEEMDGVGGVLNAFTGKEYTCYYAKVLDENFPLAIDILTDIFLHSVFDREEIERERSVVLQEIAQVEDTPEDYIHDLFNLDFYSDHPLGRPICGDADTVSSLQRQDFLNFMRDRYLPERVIIGAAGNLCHEDLVAKMEEGFSSLEEGPVEKKSALPRFHSGLFQHTKPLEQVHVCLGVAGIRQCHERRHAAYILNTLLGGGMSSRLFQEIREKRGRVYSVYSFLSSFRDVGYMGVYAGTRGDWVKEVVELIVRELGRVKDGEITEDELARVKSQLIGNTILGLESTDSWLSHMVRSEIYFGRPVPLEEISQAVRSVSQSEVVDLAREVFRTDGIALTLLGDLEGKKLDLKL